jgi:hypothetical protein
MNKLIERRVTACLLNNPHARDNDNILIADYWAMEMNDNAMRPENVQMFLDLIKNGHLCNAQSITRIRRKLQMFYPHLRGEMYQERHNQQEKVKADLGYAVDSRKD